MIFDNQTWVHAAAYAGAAVSMGFGAIGAAIGVGYTAACANTAISKNINISGHLFKIMLVGQAIAESAGCTVKVHPENIPLSYNKENLLNPWFIVERS